MKNSTSSSIKWIDSLKGLAMLGILISHCRVSSLPPPLSTLGSSGVRGVQLFFLISGFLTCISVYDDNAQYKLSNVYLKFQWIIKKYLRCAPLLIFYVMIYLIVAIPEINYWLGSQDNISIVNILSHILMLHALNPYYINSILGVEWYIGSLFIMYIISPWLLSKINNLEKALLFYLSSTFICVLVSYLLKFITILPDQYLEEVYFSLLSPIIEFPVYAAGILVYFITKSDLLSNIKNKFLFSSLLILFVSLLYISLCFDNTKLYLIFYTMIFALLVLSQVVLPNKFLCNSFFAYFGKNSYGIYLSHLLVIYFYESNITNFNNNIFLNYFLKLSFTMFFSSLISIITKKCVEKPIILFFEKRLFFLVSDE